jgi:hypothetical protein
MRPTYEIIDGVRRVKAAQIADQPTIWALINGRMPEQKILVCDLLSPKKVIDVSEPRELARWLNVRDGMADQPDLLPPIIVRRGSRGVPIADVPVIGLPP